MYKYKHIIIMFISCFLVGYHEITVKKYFSILGTTSVNTDFHIFVA